MDFSSLFSWIWESLYSIVSSVLGFLINLVFGLISIILLPIDKLIVQNIPVLSDIIFYINRLIDFLIINVNWALSWFGLTPAILQIIVAYITFKILTPIGVHSIKVGISWYRSLK